MSYESTAETLSDKIQFPSFSWTMPSDFYQTKAMAHLIQKSGRNWIGILTTDDDYGLSTLLQFSSAQSLSHVLPVHHHLPEITQTHVHRVGDAIQPSHPLSSPSPPAPNPCQHQSLFQWVNSWHEVAKVLEFQLQHQSFQWTPRTDLLCSSDGSK